MTGVFIIEGKYDDDLNTWYGAGWTRRQPVLVINQLGVSPNLLRTGAARGNTDKGPDFSVNGRPQPVLDMRPGEVQLWRIANTSGRSGAFFLGPTPGFSWRQIAQDGVQFADANYQSSLNKPFLVASGNRVDLLVKAPMTAAVYPILVQHEVDPTDLSSAYPVVLLSVRIRADAQPATGNQAQFIPTAPTPPPFLTDITDEEVKETINNPRVVAFASTPPNLPTQYGGHTINGQKFNASVVGEKVWLNAVEEWKITNATAQPNISHPFHIHVNPFQIVEVFSPNDTITVNGMVIPKYVFYNSNLQPGQCYLNANDPSTWKPCTPAPIPSPRIWWDVFPIPSGINATDQNGNPINGPNGQQILVPGYFKMRSRFVDYPGWYVLHCHILAHEDRGMMTVVEVSAAREATPVKPPFTHH
jgi:FtsP/CotA-like multicopper oxidase with cupredoxin domain